MKRATPLLVSMLVVACCAVGWFVASPSSAVKIHDAVEFGAVPASLLGVQARSTLNAGEARRSAVDLPGYDDVVFLEDGSAIASGMDGWLWRIDRNQSSAQRWFDAPLMPAGLRRSPGDPDILYFCSAILHGEAYPEGERVGLYSIRVSSREIEAIVTHVPDEPRPPRAPRVYTPGVPAETIGSRPLAFCNDLDVSGDGRRIYFTEPFAYDGASMGEGAFPEAIALGNNGRLYRHDLDLDETHLVATGFHFLDGILIEPDAAGGEESSVLITETTRFRIQRLSLSGPRAGRHDVIWEDLPGMPDGLDRDASGNIWVGMLSLRSAVTDWVHANPWIKPLILRLPSAWVPKSQTTGIMALTPDADRALDLMLHDGSLMTDISVVIPHLDRLYLASFDIDQRGLISLARPDLDIALDDERE